MPLVTTFLARWGGGWHEVTDSGAEISYGRREALLGLGALASLAEVERVAVEALVAFAAPREEITASILPTTGDDAYLDWNVGDTVTVPDSAGSPVVERVVGITVSEDNGSGRAVVNPTMRDAIVPADARMMQAVKKMVNGTLRGDAKVAQPVVPVAQPRSVFPVPPPSTCGLVTTYTLSHGIAHHVVLGPDGALWAPAWSSGASTTALVRFDRSTGVTTEFADGLSEVRSGGGICVGPDGNLWFTAYHPGPATASVVRYDPVTDTFTDFDLFAPIGLTAAGGICVGSDNNLWFTGAAVGPDTGIATCDTSGGSMAFYSDGLFAFFVGDRCGPVSGPDGNLWFTNTNGDRILKCTTGGTVTAYNHASNDRPGGIVVAAGALWFTNLYDGTSTNSQPGSLSECTTGGTITNYTDADFDYAIGIVLGGDGALWVAHGNNSIPNPNGVARFDLGSFTAVDQTLQGDVPITYWRAGYAVSSTIWWASSTNQFALESMSTLGC
jgi:hypothetical protein